MDVYCKEEPLPFTTSEDELITNVSIKKVKNTEIKTKSKRKNKNESKSSNMVTDTEEEIECEVIKKNSTRKNKKKVDKCEEKDTFLHENFNHLLVQNPILFNALTATSAEQMISIAKENIHSKDSQLMDWAEGVFTQLCNLKVQVDFEKMSSWSNLTESIKNNVWVLEVERNLNGNNLLTILKENHEYKKMHHNMSDFQSFVNIPKINYKLLSKYKLFVNSFNRSLNELPSDLE